ncbi:MAG: hypothetical protein EU542_05565 [Promethearchaeota archaeon]|nr:MAG: hypothetical protein EU542_05565 [Candidatus Lokiarchaeota archaeon]
MVDNKLPHLDILRIVSILIVVVLIHIPNDYAYSFYIGLDPYIGFLLHTLGIDIAMGSFVFISGFGLYLNKNNRNINTLSKASKFLKKRFLRIFPLYWIALILFIFFLEYTELDPLYLISHFFGMQMIVAPLYSPPILTMWFIGIIVLYYLIFLLLSSLGSIKRIIPASLIILFFFVFLNVFFGLVEYRFFTYYLLFILGIIAAHLYGSHQYNQLKEKINKLNKSAPLILALLISFLSLVIYLNLSQYCFNIFTSEFGTTHLPIILDQDLDIVISATLFLLFDLLIILYLIFAISLFHFVIKVLRKLFPKKNIGLPFSLIAYSTYCVYLFHRIFLIIYIWASMEILNVNLYQLIYGVYRDQHFILIYVFVPFIFIFSYFIQKGADLAIKLPSNLSSRRFNKQKVKEIDKL